MGLGQSGDDRLRYKPVRHTVARRATSALTRQEGLYSAFHASPLLRLGADLKVVGFAFGDRPGGRGEVWRGISFEPRTVECPDSARQLATSNHQLSNKPPVERSYGRHSDEP